MPPDADQLTTAQNGAGCNQTANHNDHKKRDEIAHVLFLDIIGFTKLRPVKQRLILEKLQEIVRETEEFCAAKNRKQLIALPTGDGMALVFLTTLEGSGPAIACAERIAEGVEDYNQATAVDDDRINVRMGIHSGNVVRVSDINNKPNVAGEGINTAQRVMDCGDKGHILLSAWPFTCGPESLTELTTASRLNST